MRGRETGCGAIGSSFTRCRSADPVLVSVGASLARAASLRGCRRGVGSAWAAGAVGAFAGRAAAAAAPAAATAAATMAGGILLLDLGAGSGRATLPTVGGSSTISPSGDLAMFVGLTVGNRLVPARRDRLLRAFLPPRFSAAAPATSAAAAAATLRWPSSPSSSPAPGRLGGSRRFDWRIHFRPARASANRRAPPDSISPEATAAGA